MPAAKLAAPGHRVAGMAHELNTPLGTTPGLLPARSVPTCAASPPSSPWGALRRSRPDSFLTRSKEAVDPLERNAARAVDPIAGFRQVAADQESVRRRRFPLRQTVEEWLLTLKPLLRNTAHRVKWDSPADLDTDDYPVRWSRCSAISSATPSGTALPASPPGLAASASRRSAVAQSMTRTCTSLAAGTPRSTRSRRMSIVRPSCVATMKRQSPGGGLSTHE